ncbi:MAG: sigma-70 family RNA polymerase sigma factor [Salinivirgaceae bacterium]|nr:sigma-70 family RNA polymerase sigma factor [Salinivirgaceae bacterium]
MRLIKKQHSSLYTSLSDIELIALFKAENDTGAVGELYERYHHIVFGVALKYLKDTDAAQDALLDVFNNLFDQLIKYEIDEFKSWLLTVTRNHCLKEIKFQQKKVSFDLPHENTFYENFMENELEIDLLKKKEEQIKQLEYAITKLKPEQQECIRLFYLEERSYQYIAEATGFDLKKVKSYIQNGKRNLQILMEQNNKL